MAPRFGANCPELIDQYIQAYRNVTLSVDELLQYQREHAHEIQPVTVSGRSLNPV